MTQHSASAAASGNAATLELALEASRLESRLESAIQSANQVMVIGDMANVFSGRKTAFILEKVAIDGAMASWAGTGRAMADKLLEGKSSVEQVHILCQHAVELDRLFAERSLDATDDIERETAMLTQRFAMSVVRRVHQGIAAAQLDLSTLPKDIVTLLSMAYQPYILEWRGGCITAMLSGLTAIWATQQNADLNEVHASLLHLALPSTQPNLAELITASNPGMAGKPMLTQLASVANAMQAESCRAADAWARLAVDQSSGQTLVGTRAIAFRDELLSRGAFHATFLPYLQTPCMLSIYAKYGLALQIGVDNHASLVPLPDSEMPDATPIMLLPSWRMEQDEWMHSMQSLKGLLPGYGAVALKEAKHVQAAG